MIGRSLAAVLLFLGLGWGGMAPASAQPATITAGPGAGQPATAGATGNDRQGTSDRAATAPSLAPTPTGTALADAVARCAALKGDGFVHLAGASTWVTDARFHAATADRRANCEVTAYVNPQIFVGVLIPADAAIWNGRYVFRGCGGSCGSLWTEGACGKHVRDGYACVFTNMGHFSDQTDNHWAQGNLQMQIDFGYRATHVAHVAGQAIVTAFLKRKPDHTYYYGCSTGGRQGMVEAQRFPEDFDGIVAIAPVNIANYGRDTKIPLSINLRDGKAILTNLDMPLLYKAVLKACDQNDGVRDGLVQPGDCSFDPAVLLCQPGQAHGCLTQDKIDVARAFYRRGALPGSELNWIDNWTADARPAVEFAEGRGDPATSDSFYNAGNPDLTALRDHGTKLMLMHGTTDLVVPAAPTATYYETVARTMGGLTETTKFFRFFEVVGMDHCSGGDGAWAINYLPIIEAWVEQGKAPARIVGKRPKPGVALDYFGIDVDRLKPDQIAFSRPYFAYPAKAYYSGHGDPDDARSFVTGLKPNHARGVSRVDALTPAPVAALATQMTSIATHTEQAYLAAGLPDKNVTDRIGKQLRFAIYNSDVPDADIARALQAALGTPLSAIQRSAFTILGREFTPR